LAFDFCTVGMIVLGAAVTIAAGFGLYCWIALDKIEKVEEAGYGWWKRN
jgi:hypothetical protein